MKKFAFALEPVLDHRKRIEDEHQRVVATCRRGLDEAQSQQLELNQEFRRYADVLRGEHRPLVAEELRLHYAHLNYLDREMTAQLRVVAERRAALERATLELLEARKQRKVVDKLKILRHDAHVVEQARIEQNELDDGNTRRHSLLGGSAPSGVCSPPDAKTS
jgi:flagellar FliJ protein